MHSRGPRIGLWILIIVALQFASIGGYVYYKRRQNAVPKKYLWWNSMHLSVWSNENNYQQSWAIMVGSPQRSIFLPPKVSKLGNLYSMPTIIRVISNILRIMRVCQQLSPELKQRAACPLSSNPSCSVLQRVPCGLSVLEVRRQVLEDVASRFIVDFVEADRTEAWCIAPAD